jgi:predicted TIM-barrel fold metal-dependent hydrolase
LTRRHAAGLVAGSLEPLGGRMPVPKNIKVIDLMMNIPTDEHNAAGYASMAGMQRDGEAGKVKHMPAEYMFKNIPSIGSDPSKFVQAIVGEMDKYNVGTSLIPLADALRNPEVKARYADRFIFSSAVDPMKGMDEVRRIRQAKKEHDIKALTYFPAASLPQVAISEREMYPIYATAIDLDIPIIVNVGVPGPRMPMRTQHVEHVDEVCWFFPDLKFVMRHGGEPWEELCVKLMLKYPNLYYAPSAFAPKHYPKAIIDFANKRGADKIMYAGYFPAGLSLERIFTELESVPFKEEVWPKFLRENAARVFKL